MTSWDLSILARAASYGDVSLRDLAPEPKRTARLSPSHLKRSRAASARLRGLVERGMLVETRFDRYEVTERGTAELSIAGYAPNRAGEWLRKAACDGPSWGKENRP